MEISKLSIEKNPIEDIIHDCFNVLGEEIEFGVDELIDEIMKKKDDEDVSVNKIMKKAYEIYRAGFLSAYLLRK